MSSSVRLRRLMADYKRVAEAFKDHPHISVRKVHGNPPEKYELEFKVTSLVSRGGRIETKDLHVVEVNLPLGYPRQAPVCRMLTPVFHPNIAPHAICIGDHWAAGESLVHLSVRIAEMLAYQSYNIKSPLNGEAARWADEHRSDLPTDGTDFAPARRPEEIVVDGSAAMAPLPVARVVPTARPIPVARVVSPPPPPRAHAAQPAAEEAGSGSPCRLTCKACGRTRMAAGGADTGQRCIYCGGEMIVTWRDARKS